MKRNILLIAPMVCLFALSGCNKQTDNYSVNIVEEKMNVDLFSTRKLEVNTNAPGTVLFTSSNPEVVKVDKDGVIKTSSLEGEAVITAKVGKFEDTCTINVVATGELSFAFANDTFTIEKGYTFKIPYVASYNGKDVTESLKLDYTSNDSDVVKVVDVVESGVIGLYGNKNGSTEITVYTQFGNGYISELLNVDVVTSSYVISSEGLQGGINSYETNIYMFSDNPNHKTELDVSNFKVYCAGKEIENAGINFSIENTSIARIEGDKLVPISVGTTNMAVSYLETTFNVKVNVNKETIALNKNVLINKLVENTVNFTSDNIAGNIQDIKIAANNQSIFKNYAPSTKVATIDNDLIPFDTKYLEEQTLVAETDKAVYTFDSKIYTAVVRTVDDLKALSNACKVSEGLYEGYVILANDINYEDSGKPLFEMTGPAGGHVDTTHGFAGIFDGNGYTISNFKSSAAYTSLFGSSLNPRGTIKNIALTGMKIIHEKTSAITQVGYGTMVNVYIRVTQVTTSSTGAALYARWMSGAAPMCRGVYIDYGETPIKASASFIPSTYQDAGKQMFTVVSGTYRTDSPHGVNYSSYKELNKDLPNQKGYLPYPYWNTEGSLSFAHYHTQSF